MPLSEIFGVRVDRVNRKEAQAAVLNFLRSGSSHYLVTLNPEFLVQARRNARFRAILNNADVALIDGVGIIWALDYFLNRIPRWLPNVPSRWLRVSWVLGVWIRSLVVFALDSLILRNVSEKRVGGVDLALQVMRVLPKNDSVFLLGGRGGTASKAARAIGHTIAEAKIVGATEGYSKISIGDGEECHIDEQEDRQLADLLDRSQPTIVLVSFGQLKQEYWIASHLLRFASVRVYMGVGGALDFYAHNIARSPVWLQRMGLEWLWRLAMEPYRIRRIFTAIIVFPILLLKDALQRTELLAR